MGHQLTVTGVAGSLRWGYHQAASLSAWTVTRTPDGWSLTATVVHADAFRLTQRPLVFVAPTQAGVWRWPLVAWVITGASLEATLGPKE